MATHQAYDPLPQGSPNPGDMPIPMQSSNPPSASKSGSSMSMELGKEDLGYQSATVPIQLLLQDDDSKLKIRIRILRFFTRLAGTAIAAGTATQEGTTLFTYLRTRDHIVQNRGPWAVQTQLGTSITLFVVSVLTVILGIVMIAAYLISVRAANRMSRVQTYFAVLVELGHIAVWIFVAVYYRAGKNGQDLWGWACSPLAAQLQPTFEGVVNFDSVCRRGDRSWRLTIASAGVQIVNGFVWYMAYRRRQTKKSLQEHEDPLVI